MGPKWASNKWDPFIWGPFGAHLLFGPHLGPFLGTRGPYSRLFFECQLPAPGPGPGPGPLGPLAQAMSEDMDIAAPWGLGLIWDPFLNPACGPFGVPFGANLGSHLGA